ncbi:EFR1 family ferrodoxin [Methanospirillum lacunae]|uniref:Ferredoxin n=1 Tax=Methanospirillum lacunae TaxID=668570 RepID=A0A2V2N954_9EURY|nr:EFR1 family ferrodoxin [Methanospirillum lacunae]PWR74186.1 ferredoxin [Methanospirillum lacunae]
MEIKSTKLLYFSPTGTTKTVLSAIARGLNPDKTEQIDITTPKGREQSVETSEDELLIIGVPVYMGRIPALIVDWLNEIRAHQTPTVCVVVYGNRIYEDALLELKNIVKKCGGIPIAGGAYIGEHSFSKDDTPIAVGRPDTHDLHHAEEFGRKIKDKLQSLSSGSMISEIELPGEFPYRSDSKLWIVDFIAVNDDCTDCGHCVEICPSGAIDPQNSSKIDTEKCITCCACIKNCPVHARSMKPGLVQEASVRLFTLYSDPKMPENYL